MYVSRSGNDEWSCDQSNPCKTIGQTVMLASIGDTIHIDGNNTDRYPYTCQSGTSQHPGIYINRTLSLIGSANPMPQIRCFEETGLVFNGSYSAEDTNITISGLLFTESLVYVQDSSVHISGRKFQGSNQSVEIVIRYSAFSKMLVTNSTFSKNRRCISIVVQSEMTLSPNIQLIFKLSNSSFDGNLCVDRGGCILICSTNLSPVYRPLAAMSHWIM